MKSLFLSVVALCVLSVSALAADPREELQQLVTQLQSNPSDAALREKIIKIAQTIKPAPALPEEAERRMARGTAAFQGAKTPADYQTAAGEFEQAINAAPWYGDAYYNLGLAQDKAGDHAGALRNLNLAVLASPDNREIKNLLYQVEFRRDQASASAQKTADAARVLDALRGNWNAVRCHTQELAHDGCTRTEYLGANWRRIRDFNTNSPWVYQFKFLPDGKVEVQDPIFPSGARAATWGLYGIVKKLVGTPNGRGDAEQPLDWICHYDTDNRTNPAYFRVVSTGFLFSCNLDVNDHAPGKRWHFIEFRRP